MTGDITAGGSTNDKPTAPQHLRWHHAARHHHRRCLRQLDLHADHGAAIIGTVTDDVAPVTGAITAGSSTNDATPTLAGTAEAGSTITVYDNGTAIGTTTADASGNWTFTPTTALATSAFTLTVAAGNHPDGGHRRTHRADAQSERWHHALRHR